MYKLVLFVIVLLLNTAATSQSVNSVKQLILANKLIEAKTAIENLLANKDSANNSNAWYFKGFIYNLLSKDSSISIPLTNAKAIAFNAFSKCLSLTPNHKWLAKDNFAPLFDIYISFFEAGKQAYAAQQFELAFEHFINAEKVENYLFEHKIRYKQFSFTAIDTSLIYNIATAAIKANKEKEGIYYYTKIAEFQLKDPTYLPIYHALVDYYISINDEIGFRRYLKIGQKLFPYDNYWVQAELDMVNASKLNEALVHEHQQKIKQQPNNKTLRYQFINDLLQILYAGEHLPKKYTEWKTTLVNELSILTQTENNNSKTAFLQTMYYYKDANAEHITLKNEEERIAYKKEMYSKAIPYATIVFEDLERNTKCNRQQLEQLKQTTKILIEMQTLIGNTEAVKELQEKQQQFEALLPVLTVK